MASNHVYVDAPPQAVWEVLADPSSCAHWVVGSSRTRRVEGAWPAKGSRFHHTQGLGPLGIRDTTAVIESRRAKRLVLEVRMRPVVVARTELSLAAHGEGTWLTIRESPSEACSGALPAPCSSRSSPFATSSPCGAEAYGRAEGRTALSRAPAGAPPGEAARAW